MALKKEGPEFDRDDEVLLLEPGIMLDESSADEQPSPRATPKATTSFSSKQHKHIDYTRARWTQRSCISTKSVSRPC